MRKFKISGMSCAACQARVEKAVNAVEGVESCSVSLITNTMIIEGSAPDDSIIKAVVNAGYGAKVFEKECNYKVESKQSLKLTGRLIFSGLLLLVLMYFSMGSMLGLPMVKVLSNNPLIISLIQMYLSLAIIFINKKIFINGFKGAVKLSPNMDTLVSLGSSVSFCYSLYLLYIIGKYQFSGNTNKALHVMHSLYFESAAMILTLVTVGKFLESLSKDKTTNALKKLINLKPQTATVLINSVETKVNVSEIKQGDVFIVKPGDIIPVDGVVIKGTTSVDESMLTGESIPMDKFENDSVFCGCVNLSGYIECRAVSVGEDTTLAKIIKTVNDTLSSKAPIARLADKVSGVFVPFVLLLSVATFLIWTFVADKSIYFALTRAIAVLVISCPCALGLATPVAVTVGNGVGAKNGILFKNAVALENCGKIKTVVFDKTGTLTFGKPIVTDLVPTVKKDKALLINCACSLEKFSEHPLAKAITNFGTENNVTFGEVTDFYSNSGNGLRAKLNGKELYGGKYDFVKQFVSINKKQKSKANELAEQGKTPLFFAYNGRFIGIIAVADTLKPDSKATISAIKKLGCRVIMLTGDNQKTAEYLGNELGIDEIISNVLPEQKSCIVQELCEKNKVAMIGDGINDAPALTAADVGIAIGAGSDIAVDSADVVLMKSNISDAYKAIKLSKKTLKNIKQNLFWAFFYNILCIPLAAGAFIPLFNFTLNPMVAAAAMSLSSVCVVTNALRLNFIKLDLKKAKNDLKITLKVDGMMCEHCEKHVKDALEALKEVDDVIADHTTGIVEIFLKNKIDINVLKNAIKNEGYKVIE